MWKKTHALGALKNIQPNGLQNGRTLRMPLFELCSLSSSERQKFDVIASNNELKLDDHRATNRSKKKWGGRERKWIARVTRFVHVHSFCLLLCCCIGCRTIHFTTHTHSHTPEEHAQLHAHAFATAVLPFAFDDDQIAYVLELSFTVVFS